MKYVIISAFDAVQEASMPLQCIQDMLDEDIIESHRRAVLMKKIPAEIGVNLVIFKYGTFDDKTGVIDLLDYPVKLCALAPFYKTATVAQSEATQNDVQK